MQPSIEAVMATLAEAMTSLATTHRATTVLTGWTLALVCLGVCGLGFMLWHTLALVSASTAHTQALTELLQRLPK